MSIKKPKHTILVVDDESLIVELIVECLLGSDYQVITASNGVDAIAQYHKYEPDLIISDIVMPEMDGISMVKKLQESFPDIKVLLMTGYPGLAREALGNQMNELGVVCLMEKPLNVIELISTVHVLLLDKTMMEFAAPPRNASVAEMRLAG